jgi:hypothetical protein
MFFMIGGKKSLRLSNNLQDFAKVAAWVEERFRKLE